MSDPSPTADAALPSGLTSPAAVSNQQLTVGISLFTMTPAHMTGTASYARAVIGGLLDPVHAIHPVVLVNRLMRDLSTRWRLPRGCVTEIRSIPLRDSPQARLALIAHSMILPWRTARQIAAEVSVVHYPLTLPFPRTAHPRVVTLHDVIHHDLPHFFTPAQRRWRMRAYDESARSASVVVTPCEHAKARAIAALGLEPKKIEVIPLGIDHTTYTPHSTNDERFLGPLGLPDRFLLYPAALLPHKNHHALIEALALLADRDIALVLTGPDRGRLSNLKACARRMHVEHRVRHLGYVSDLELASLYRQATLLVFPSLYEGFGAPPIEAMACGCPVAVSRETSLPEVCGNAAVYFDARRPEDIAATVDTALGDAALRQSLTHRGLERAARFTWEAAAARHALVYRRAIVEQLDFPGPSA